MTNRPKVKVNYVDNERLSNELIQWVDQYHKNEAEGLPKPVIPRFIGECILKIATNLARHPNFNRYTWLEEMVGDAVENTIRYLHNFNSNAETRTGKPNAFSWMTLSMERVFYDRIESENRQIYYRNRMGSDAIGDMAAEGEFEGAGSDAAQAGVAQQMFKDMTERAGEYEKAQQIRKEKERARAKLKEREQHPSTISLLDVL